MDGQLNKISTSLSFSRNWTVKAASNVPAGTYYPTITIHALLDGIHSVQTLPLTVTIGPKSHFTYQTSSVSTLAPIISNVQFSKNVLSLHRVESDSFSVSFTNHGSPTDYLFRLVEPTIGFSTTLTNATHRFVSPGETVTAFVNVQTTSTSPFGTTPIRMEAYNLATGEREFLGTVEVSVVEVTNLVASLPFREYQIPQTETFSTFITLQNTEWNDVDVIIASSSSQVHVLQNQVHVPSKSSVSIPIQLNASIGLGTIEETIYVTNAQFTASIPFFIQTIEKKAVAVDLETREMPFTIENDDTQTWQDVSFIVTQKPENWDIGFSQSHFALPAQESKTLTLTISAPKEENEEFTIEVFNEGVLVQTKTLESKPTLGLLANATGLVTRNASSVFGMIVLVFALLIVFSKSVRNRIRAHLPQQTGDVIHREESPKR
jgi:hypothetical protein